MGSAENQIGRPRGSKSPACLAFTPWLAIVGLVVVACGPGRHPYLKDPSRHPRLGGARYLVATGTGSTIQQAKDDARSVISHQISTRLVSATREYVSSRVFDGVEFYQEHIERITRTTTAFAYAAMVQFDEELTQLLDGPNGKPRYEVFGYLSKRKLRPALEHDVEAPLARLREMGKRVPPVEQQRDLMGLRALLEDAVAASSQIDLVNRQALVLFGDAVTREHLAILNRVAGAHGRLKAATGFVVSATPAGAGHDALLANLTGEITRGLQAAGLRAEVGACGQPDAHYEVQVEPATRCQLRTSVYICRTTATVEILECASGSAQSMTSVDGTRRPARSKAAARARAVSSFDVAALRDRVRRILSEMFEPRLDASTESAAHP